MSTPFLALRYAANLGGKSGGSSAELEWHIGATGATATGTTGFTILLADNITNYLDNNFDIYMKQGDTTSKFGIYASNDPIRPTNGNSSKVLVAANQSATVYTNYTSSIANKYDGYSYITFIGFDARSAYNNGSGSLAKVKITKD